MPKNRIHETKDGRKSYNATDAFGQRRTIKQRKAERVADFRRRCDELDKLCESSGGSVRTFGDLFEKFRTGHLENTSNANRVNVQKMYTSIVKPEFGHRDLIGIRTQDVYAFLQAKIASGYSKEYVSKIRQCISAPYRFGVQNGLVSKNPCAGIRLTYSEANERTSPNVAMSDADLERFFDAAENTKYLAAYKLMLHTGMRPSECLGLQWSDIKDGYIWISRAVTMRDQSRGKTESARRKIPVSESIQSILDTIPIRSEWLFPCGGTGEPNMAALTSAFKRSLHRTGVWIASGKRRTLITPPLKLTLYSFRHTFATRCARNGMAARMLQYLMGHRKIETTLSYYVDIETEDFKAAAEVMERIAF